jgi:hypothetical protein
MMVLVAPCRISGLQKNVTPEVFAQAASGGADFHPPTAQIIYQGSQIADNWTSTPRCISVYLDAPSWLVLESKTIL